MSEWARAGLETPFMDQKQQDLTPAGTGARELDRITAAHAHATDGAVRHRLWLDEQAGVLLFLERVASGEAEGPTSHRIPLRSAACTRVLTDLTAGVLARLAAPADHYRDRSEADRDIGALVQLFRAQLARMRTEHADPSELVQAIHAQVERAEDEERTARRTAFLGWYLEHTYGDHSEGHERAEEDLGYDIEEGVNTDLDRDFVARTISHWSWYRQGIRSRVPQPRLEQIPGDRRLGRRDRHWYYEFRTLGRRLTEQHTGELRARLPGADITSDSLVLDQWSDQTEHPIFDSADEIVSRYFDAGLYFSQAGSRTLWLRLPAALASRTAPFEGPLGVETKLFGDDLVLRLHRQEEDGDGTYLHDDPRPWLRELLPLRDDLIAGDLRAPAIAWRAADETLPFTRAAARPPMPEGLDEDELTPQLHALIRLLEESP
ncbi:hypothetical protein [Streptomyces sp. YU58]|uniref:hypothetical protein n=1 Tax=Streptomyces sp. SX92 TaxID=3158972 RepID=UPI0027B9E55A|nr:hypothetical protein [Streptomyces coralus]WLW57181.1 hypothetical protein QU709_40045 [Streptomyces coralus]